MSRALTVAWDRLLPSHPQLGQSLLERWSAPERKYHDIEHLDHCLAALTALGSTAVTEQLAIWFHDAIHTNAPGADERASARLAHDELTAVGLDADNVSDVVRLVLATIDHRPDTNDAASARVCDADLAILGSQPACYLRSVARLRAELPHVNDAEWRLRRLGRLDQLITATPLFHTAAGQRLWQSQAAANLREEHNRLLAD